MSYTKLIKLATLEAASDEPDGKEKLQFVEWINFTIDNLTEKNDYVWSYKILYANELQPIDPGSSGYAYAYSLPSGLLSIKAVNVSADYDHIPNIRYALDRSLPFDINWYIDGAVSSEAPSFRSTNDTLYSSVPADCVIAKLKIRDVNILPVQVQQMLVAYIKAMLVRRTEGTAGAVNAEYKAKTLEASVAANSLRTENSEQEIIARYLRKTYRIGASI